MQCSCKCGVQSFLLQYVSWCGVLNAASDSAPSSEPTVLLHTSFSLLIAVKLLAFGLGYVIPLTCARSSAGRGGGLAHPLLCWLSSSVALPGAVLRQPGGAAVGCAAPSQLLPVSAYCQLTFCVQLACVLLIEPEYTDRNAQLLSDAPNAAQEPNLDRQEDRSLTFSS